MRSRRSFGRRSSAFRGGRRGGNQTVRLVIQQVPGLPVSPVIGPGGPMIPVKPRKARF